MDYDYQYPMVRLRLPFDEADGSTSTADYSLAPKSITLHNVEIDSATAMFGNSLKFGATAGRLQAAHHEGFILGEQDWRIDIWVYPTSNPATVQTLMAKRASASSFDWIQVYYDPGFGIRARVASSAGAWANTTNPRPWVLNSWNHIRVLRRGSNFALGVNGGTGAGSLPANLYTGSAPLTIGANADGSEPFLNGWIDDVRVRIGGNYPVSDISAGSYFVPTEPFDIAPFAGKIVEPLVPRKYLGGETPLPKAIYMPPRRALRNFLIVDGTGRISGTVKEKNAPANTPLARRVVLLRDIDAQVIAETISDPLTGAYEFTRLREGLKYTVLAFDHKHNYRAVVADNLEPTL